MRYSIQNIHIYSFLTDQIALTANAGEYENTELC